MKYYTHEERGELAKELIALTYEYRDLNEAGDILEQANTRSRIANVALNLCQAVFALVPTYGKLSHSEMLNCDGFEDCILDSALILMDKICNMEYDPGAKKDSTGAMINFAKMIIFGQTQNLMRKLNTKQRNETSFNVEINSEDHLEMLDTLESDENVNDEVIDNYMMNKIIKILQEFSDVDKDQQFINLLFVDKIKGCELSNKEIAEIMGCSPAYVVKKTKQLRSKLKDRFIEEGLLDC